MQPSTPFNDYDLAFNLGFTAASNWDLGGELEFVQTPRQNFGVRSGAIQARYRFLNDISGDDPISLVVGLSLRGVTKHSLQDVSSPYASDFNGEITCSLGREWANKGHWTTRTYGLVAVGMANRSYPWTRGLYAFEKKWRDTHRLSLFTLGSIGFGPRHHVDVNHFDGWGKFHYQSIDLGATYGYQFSVWGTLSLSYAHRVFARNFPQAVNWIALEYHLPFSPF
ncbi:MAG: hypothetical protein JSS61_05760 [Verrucomicrobia bacterium]|nr:hypothetical protein [Verrucomicrobiota bacterium]